MSELKCGVCNFYEVITEVEKARNLMTTISEDSKWIIPSYQRGYKWEKEQFVEFKNKLEEFIESSSSKNKYFGQIILHSNAEGDFEIVDGQQRLTTFMILAKLIIDSEGDDLGRYKERIDIIRNYMYIGDELRFVHQNINKKYIDQYIFLEKPSVDDHKDIGTAYDQFLKDKDANQYRKTLSKKYRSNGIKQYKKEHYNSVVLAYDMLSEWFSGLDTTKKGYLIEGITSKIEISYLLSLKFDIAYESFLALNVSGKPLSNFDIIKSVFIGEISIFDKSINKEWEEKIERIEVSESKVVDIIEIMLKLEYTSYLQKDGTDKIPVLKRTEIYAVLQDLLRSQKTEMKKKEVFQNVVTYVKNYDLMHKGNFKDVIGKASFGKYNASVKSLLNMDYVPFLPTIFEYIKSGNYDASICDLINFAKYMPFIYVTVFGQKSTKLTKISNDYIYNVTAGVERCEALDKLLKDFHKILPSTNFKKELASNTQIKNNDIAKEILLILEDNLGSNDKYENHLEHTYPLKPKKGQWVTFQEYREYVHYIGNFVIIPEELNKKIKNSEFSEKKKYVKSGDINLDAFKYAKELYDQNEDFTPELVEQRSLMYSTLLYDKFAQMKLLQKENDAAKEN